MLEPMSKRAKNTVDDADALAGFKELTLAEVEERLSSGVSYFRSVQPKDVTFSIQKRSALLKEFPILRRDADGDTDQTDYLRIEGYAIVYEMPGNEMDYGGGEGYQEIVTRGACDEVLHTGPDVAFLKNHNPDMVMARTTAGTLMLRAGDPIGVPFTSAVALNTTYAKDFASDIQNGNINACSFSFSILPGGAVSSSEDNGIFTRRIDRVGELYDVSGVTYPAYPQTSLGIIERSLSRRWVELRSKATPAVPVVPAAAAAAAVEEAAASTEAEVPEVPADTETPETPAVDVSTRDALFESERRSLEIKALEVELIS